jgi:transcription-repair coupling factor (superfamily II helicase)
MDSKPLGAGSMQRLLEELGEELAERFATAIVSAAGPTRLVSGLMGPARAFVEAALVHRESSSSLVVVADERRSSPVASDLTAFLRSIGDNRAVLHLPAFVLDPYRGLSPHLDVRTGRALALSALARSERVIVVAPAAALLYRTTAPALLSKGTHRLETGSRVELDSIALALTAAGYRHEDPVTTPGDFARRGGILDVFPPGDEQPLRIELLGDEVEELRRFDPESQLTTEVVSRAVIGPASEWVVSEEQKQELCALFPDDSDAVTSSPGIGFVLPRLDDYRATVFDYADQALVLVEDVASVIRAAETEWERVLASYDDAEDEERIHYAEPSRLLMDIEELGETLRERAVALEELSLLENERQDWARHLSTQLLPSFRGRMPDFLAEARRRVETSGTVRMFVGTDSMVGKTVELLSEAGLTVSVAPDGEREEGREQERTPSDGEGQIVLHRGMLSQSFAVPELSLTVFAGRDVLAEPPRPVARKGVRLGRFLSDFRDLAIGDYVVHTDHGIGAFTGLKKLSETSEAELVALEYLGGDRLYVPVDRLDLLEKYSSAEGARPRLDRLGGTGWEKVKTRVRKSMRDMARELLKLYAQRQAAPGHGFSEDGPWTKEFEALFPFEETADQSQAIEDVKADMEQSSPMDRLVCGDVGYGKTEVAMRAAFKAVMDGKQVAVLVPTTVLAFQHQNTFSERFARFPVRVEMLSRFRSRSEQKQIVLDLADGKIDIVIGTHRLLSKDVSFHDLGLLIVDEEQRFGVSHKEKLKKFRAGIDCLALSATPIPRTLHMSLSGIRDLSIIETPPKDRMAIQTHITRLDSKVLAEAIRYELGRSGQVYFVHNRIGSIYSMANYLQRLVPEARIGVGHGQMKESELERVMLRFIRHEFDILVSTTIIENGLDIPLVNTLIVNRADRFGLSQLYQLRGRVGRSNRRAFAYLLVPEETRLTPIAQRRLAAIREFSELGAGFRIAALDLELRGAGNLLGGEQHGHIEAVGFDLYCRLLDEAVHELAGEDGRPTTRASLNLRLGLRIPPTFIEDMSSRMSVYKRASSARERDEVDRLEEQTRDRFGPLPEPVVQFFDYARLQVLANELRITTIERDHGSLSFGIGTETGLGADEVAGLTRDYQSASVSPNENDDGVVFRLPYASSSPSSVLEVARDVLLRIAAYSKMGGNAPQTSALARNT